MLSDILDKYDSETEDTGLPNTNFCFTKEYLKKFSVKTQFQLDECMAKDK